MTGRWRVLPSAVHGLLDFAAAMVLIVVAFVAADTGTVRALLFVLGGGILIYSALTDYELGFFRVLPLPVHLAIDFALGILLLLLPSLMEMPTVPAAVLYALGCISIIASLTTRLRAGRLAMQDLVHEPKP